LAPEAILAPESAWATANSRLRGPRRGGTLCAFHVCAILQGEGGVSVITADQILVHLIGDYILQSDWMATEKVKRFLPAALHAFTYSLSFIFFRPSLAAWLVIVVSHFFIDRYRLARYLVWAKNFIAPRRRGVWCNPSWAECKATGYPPERPDWLTVWLLIIADNICHLVCNGLALKFL
jgi:hypothetical protein